MAIFLFFNEGSRIPKTPSEAMLFVPSGKDEERELKTMQSVKVNHHHMNVKGKHIPILIFKILVQLSLVVNRGDSAGKLLVFPGVCHGDPTGPHSKQRDRS